MSQLFSRQPPTVSEAVLTFPSPHVLLVTFNRSKQLNALPRQAHLDLSRVWNWYDTEPSLRCAIITGKGNSFCAGADLKEWHQKSQAGIPSHDIDGQNWLENGFGGMSNRQGKKPIIAAVNGHCFGGGFEMVLNSDCVIASESAAFGLPEVTRGVAAIAGALPRLMRTVGRQRASEMALLGRTYAAQQLCDWGIVNKVVSEESVLGEAMRWASEVANNSPDAIIFSRAGLLRGWDGEDPTYSAHKLNAGMLKILDGGYNMKEGLLSFIEKRKPSWIDSRL